jgi:hypothetical protein
MQVFNITVHKAFSGLSYYHAYQLLPNNRLQLATGFAKH